MKLFPQDVFLVVVLPVIVLARHIFIYYIIS